MPWLILSRFSNMSIKKKFLYMKIIKSFSYVRIFTNNFVLQRVFFSLFMTWMIAEFVPDLLDFRQKTLNII